MYCVQAPPKLTHESHIRISRSSLLTEKGRCNIIFCDSCLIQANKFLSTGTTTTSSARRSGRELKRTERAIALQGGVSKATSPCVEDCHCPCPSNDCGKISGFEKSHDVASYGAYKNSSVHTFQTFCCDQTLVYSKKRS
mmetsp:Transcript_20965/g.32852  ORF Transcript_20965/g.32852 Transcript_20965/m.32852 type:complete len:139 (-) Transcript_20965:121-537(-)